MYRAIGYHILNNGIDIESKDLVEAQIEKINLNVVFDDGKQSVILNGEDITDKIREPEISMAASKVGAYRKVRGALVKLQKQIANKHDMILDGRDIGTVVLAHSNNKFFLTATSDVRARRRHDQLVSRGVEKSILELKKEIDERDYFDSHREVDPLRCADDAIEIDSSDMSINEVVDMIICNLEEK